MPNREHKDITDPNIHEPKGASTASVGQIIRANGDGTTSWVAPTVYSNVAVGWYNMTDTATAGSPIPLTVAGTIYDLTNNAAGAESSTAYGVTGVGSVWNTGTNQFNFAGLAVGDVLIVSADITVTTTNANTAIDLLIELGVGQPGVYSIPLLTSQNVKTASTVRFVGQKMVTLKSTVAQNFPARIRAKADTVGATVVVNNFIVEVMKRG